MKTVLITGASQGIGKATAQYYSENNYKVMLLARNEEKLKEVKESLPGPSEYYICDVTNKSEVQEAAQKIMAEEKYLTAVIHNAGIALAGTFEDTSIEDWSLQYNVNVIGMVSLTKALLPTIKKSGTSLVLVSSSAAKRPVANLVAYSASKAALLNLTENLAVELAPYKARVNCICPGLVETPIHPWYQTDKSEKLISDFDIAHPLGRIGQPQDIAEAIYSLSNQKWTTGSIVTVDGGISLV